MSGPVLCEPVTPLLPPQAPDAEHAVALEAFQFSVALPPLVTLVAVDVNDTTGAGTASTATVADCVVVPPRPVHAKVKVVAEDKAAVASEPFNGLAPVQPPEPKL